MNTADTFEKQQQLERAKAEVKKIKGFYNHALIYAVVNLIIVISNVQSLEVGESYFQFHNFITLIFWGFGLLIHGITVFLPKWLLGKNWEERKIKQYMESYNKNN
ncbi:2TM domain-containing protein [Bizionia sp. KMM 8389]